MPNAGWGSCFVLGSFQNEWQTQNSLVWTFTKPLYWTVELVLNPEAGFLYYWWPTVEWCVVLSKGVCSLFLKVLCPLMFLKVPCPLVFLESLSSCVLEGQLLKGLCPPVFLKIMLVREARLWMLLVTLCVFPNAPDSWQVFIISFYLFPLFSFVSFAAWCSIPQ